MSKNYYQLSSEQRYQIEALINAGNSQKSVAYYLGVSPSTICRELRRNGLKTSHGKPMYRARSAQERTIIRQKSKAKHTSFTKEMKDLCRSWLEKERYSPEIISVVGKRLLGQFVSHETIYKWIWYCKWSYKRENRKNRQLYTLLRHGRKRYKRGSRNDKRGNFPHRVMIDKRPAIVIKRKRLGDIEVDLMLGKKHKSQILVCLDRASLKVTLRKLQSKKSTEVKKVLLKAFQKSKHWLNTITFDNDSAFMLHHHIASKLEIQSYFTRPYTSQDKGSVENRIGVLRRFLPKGMDLTGVTTHALKAIEDKLNNRPVRKFKYKTPNQIFSEKIALTT